MKDPTFFDLLREAESGTGRGNDELIRAVLPLLEQLDETHASAKVSPLADIEKVFSVRGALWYHGSDAIDPVDGTRALEALEKNTLGGIDVVERGKQTLTESSNTQTIDQLALGETVDRAAYLPGYGSWELELGHHDALTDIFLAGMLLASLATGLDFTEPAELSTFVHARHRLKRLNESLHPVIARAIVRMTELDRHERVQDLPTLIERLRNYRDVDERVDTDLDFESIEGFVTADRTSRRKIIQSVLQTRLFDLSRRNRLIYFKPTLQMLDLTMASVPTQLAVDRIQPDDLFLWDGKAGKTLVAGKSIRLDSYLRFEEAPWIKGTLDRARSEDRRSRTEVGFSQLRLVVAFLNWHNLKEDEEQRIRSPLLLLPASLTLQRGVRNSYVLTPTSEMAEVNPVLRHYLTELYGLELPEQVDLSKSDVDTFHKALAAAIARSEPAVTLHKITRPQIRLLRQTSKRRTDTWRRRSRVSGRGLRSAYDVDYSYAKSNLKPMGLQLYLHKVQREKFRLEQLLESAKVLTPTPSPQAPTEDVTVTERQVFTHIEAAAGPYDWAVDLTHLTIGNFNYRKMSLVRDYDRMLEEEDGVEHPSFDTLFSLEARDVSAPEPERASLDLFTVVPTDPSQAAAVRWARSGRSLIIQGPPGTGKSQTITNLIADCAARGQKVLFVCQKRAALDVVYHRLTQHGLDELSVLIHDAQGDKREFIADLKSVYESWTRPVAWPSVEPERDALLAELDAPLGAMQRFGEGMERPVVGGSQPLIQAIGARLTQGDAAELTVEQRELLPSHGDWQAHRHVVHDAARALGELGQSDVFSALALRHIGVDILDSAEPVSTLKRSLDRLQQLLDAVRTAWTQVKPDATSEDLAEALVLAEQIAPLLPNQLGLLDLASGRSLQLEQANKALVEAQRAAETTREKTRHWKEKLAAEDTETALVQARRFAALFILFRFFFPSFWSLRGLLNQRYAFSEHAVQPTYVDVLERLQAEHAADAAVDATERDARDQFGFEGSLSAFTEVVQRLRDPSGRTPLQRELVKTWSREPDVVQAILDARTAIAELQTEAGRIFDGGATLDPDTLQERIDEARASADLLGELRSPLRALYEAPDRVRRAVRTLPLRPAEWDATINAAAIESSFDADRPLARFGDASLKSKQIAVSHGHHKLLALNGRLIRERVRERFRERVDLTSRPAAELSDEEKPFKKAYNAGRRELEREFEKVMRHKSIRSLSSGDSGTVVYDLKPIWLMSPLSISDTIPMDAQRFDVVIFDEASQIPLEEAVPAVYRAPQMIVVGDEQQLPPTKFFASAKAADDSEMDAATAEVHYDLDAESFLSHSARCLPSTMLMWHYRSRHEALITFSNQMFYAGDLRTVPDRLRSVERDPIEIEAASEGDGRAIHVLDRPVSYHRLSKSPYARRTNSGEATYIAHLVRGLLKEAPEKTLGIVAFSEAQQGEIERALNTLGASDPVFRRALDAAIEREDDGQLVGLFVKNLENVQGDERDIIVLSICYGPDANGKMRMNFGPINKGGGEKRLNVVFSRAKRHMAVVASIDPSQITNLYNDGASCMKRYLQFAQAASIGDDVTMANVSRALSREAPKRSVRNPVVSALADALEDEGLVVQREVGASEFQVDLAVGRDDENALGVAVLVDGPATYGDFDPIEHHHTRPSVLRAFGWTVVNVLTKDWLADRAGCIQRVLRALEDPASAAMPPPPDVDREPEPTEPIEPEAPASDGPLELRDQTMVLTGSFGAFTRDEARARIQAVGGRVATAITRRTAFLVVGKRPGSKLTEAQEKGIRIVSEAELLSALERAEQVPR